MRESYNINLQNTGSRKTDIAVKFLGNLFSAFSLLPPCRTTPSILDGEPRSCGEFRSPATELQGRPAMGLPHRLSRARFRELSRDRIRELSRDRIRELSRDLV